jgi:hypothetical protein
MKKRKKQLYCLVCNGVYYSIINHKGDDLILQTKRKFATCLYDKQDALIIQQKLKYQNINVTIKIYTNEPIK